MRILDLGAEQARQVTRHGSRFVSANPVLHGDQVAVTVLRVGAGGEIGEHPAVVDQLFVVVAGRGAVCGGDGVWQPIASGQAALWTAGEKHITRADEDAEEDLVAVVVEMPNLVPPEV